MAGEDDNASMVSQRQGSGSSTASRNMAQPLLETACQTGLGEPDQWLVGVNRSATRPIITGRCNRQPEGWKIQTGEIDIETSCRKT
jgi:hypothetical protein